MSVSRYSNVLKKAFQSNWKTEIQPFKLTAVVTKSCQSRCIHCEIWKEIPENEITLEEFERVAQFLPKLMWLDLTGGEPTDREDLADNKAN